MLAGEYAGKGYVTLSCEKRSGASTSRKLSRKADLRGLGGLGARKLRAGGRRRGWNAEVARNAETTFQLRGGRWRLGRGNKARRLSWSALPAACREAPHGTSALRRDSAFPTFPPPQSSDRPPRTGLSRRRCGRSGRGGKEGRGERCLGGVSAVLAFSAALRETLRGLGGLGARKQGAGERRRGKPRGGENPEAQPVASRMVRSPAEEHRIPMGGRVPSGSAETPRFPTSPPPLAAGRPPRTGPSRRRCGQKREGYRGKVN
jgi:hypothetical protein